MAKRVGNYLRARRRQAALFQKELAFLLGYAHRGSICRLEHSGRKISFRIALACEIVFGVDARELFPALVEQVEEGVVRRMYELHQKCQLAKPSRRNEAKLAFLQSGLQRAMRDALTFEV